MDDLASKLITLYQALQLVGLAPSLFLILFLTVMLTKNKQALVPMLYFISLSCSFVLPMLDIDGIFHDSQWLFGGLMFGESVLVACCFLLIMQFMLDRVPPWPYWLVFAVPLVGGSTIIYLSVTTTGHECVASGDCPNLDVLKTFYNMFSSALVFLLVTYYASRFKFYKRDAQDKHHRYWLVVAIIILHLAVLALELSQMANRITQQQMLFSATVIRLSFIYLVMTSLFRVFYPNLVRETLYLEPEPVTRFNEEADKPHLDMIHKLIDDEHVYREMRLNRAALARKVGIGENYLSRLINHYFGKSFNELINGYRVEDAKRRLTGEAETPVTTIAFEVGFNSIASFNRVFKEMVGLSPSDWRAGKTTASSPLESVPPVGQS